MNKFFLFFCVMTTSLTGLAQACDTYTDANDIKRCQEFNALINQEQQDLKKDYNNATTNAAIRAGQEIETRGVGTVPLYHQQTPTIIQRPTVQPQAPQIQQPVTPTQPSQPRTRIHY